MIQKMELSLYQNMLSWTSSLFDEENAEPMSPLRLPSVGYGSTKDLSGKSASMRRSTNSHF